MSDDPQRIPNWVSRLLQETEDADREERQIARLHAEASLQRAKNKGTILNACLHQFSLSAPNP